MSMQRPIGVAGRQLGGFQKFLLRGNVIDLAVAVVIGVAFTAVVSAFVKDLLTPFLGVFGGTPDFSQVYFTINSSRFLVGEFINALLSLLIVALVLYFFVVVPVNALMERAQSREPTAPATRECPECLSKVPVAARRCAFCTSPLPLVETTTA
jgi:large conductance mechanosensitive channel